MAAHPPENSALVEVACGCPSGVRPDLPLWLPGHLRDLWPELHTMRKPKIHDEPSTDERPPLAIPLDKVCWVIMKLRELDVKEAANDPDPASNASDDKMVSVLEDRPDDPVHEELTAAVSTLSADEQIDLVALLWLGRDDNSLDDWPTIRAEAARAHASHAAHTASYLLGEPLASDFLEEALSLFGQSCEDFEIDRL